MPQLKLYNFSPSKAPPDTIEEMDQWFNDEVTQASIEPSDTFDITNQGPVNGSSINLPLAEKIFQGIQLLKKAWMQFKQRWSKRNK